MRTCLSGSLSSAVSFSAIKGHSREEDKGRAISDFPGFLGYQTGIKNEVKINVILEENYNIHLQSYSNYT